jgi:hypothetical protein
MTGLTNYSADNQLNYITGQIPMPALPAIFLALFTGVGTDAGTGFTEVSGGAYARVQIAGSLTAGAAWTTTTPTIPLSAAVPSWVVPGMSVYDVTSQQEIGTVQSVSGSNVTLTANAAHASSGSGDTISFSAFGNATGTSPSSVTNGAVITYPAATANWGTVIAWGLYDASSAGDFLWWDYLGNYNWLPATVTAGSPGVITAHAHGYNNGDSVVFSTEYGGTAPTFSSGSYSGLLTVAGSATDTFDISGVNTSTSGDGMVRKVTQQIIPANVTASFAASSFTLMSA